MSKPTVGRTALGAAVCRLMEQYESDENRLFEDPLAGVLVGSFYSFLYRSAWLRDFTKKQMDAITPGIYGIQVCRTCCINDAVHSAVDEGIRQAVILGAGLDTRAYLLPELQQTAIFEVDLPSVQNEKMKRLRRHYGELPAHVTYLPIDFDRQNLGDIFSGSSFDPGKKTLFIWEAVTQYISEASVRQTLSFIARSTPGSHLIFTYVLKSVIERNSGIAGMDKMMDAVTIDSPWIFGIDPAELAVFLKPYRLQILDDAGSEEFEKTYLAPKGRSLPVNPCERVAHARVVE